MCVTLFVIEGGSDYAMEIIANYLKGLMTCKNLDPIMSFTKHRRMHNFFRGIPGAAQSR